MAVSQGLRMKTTKQECTEEPRRSITSWRLVLIALASASLSAGCAVKPEKKVAHGQDENLFLKSELVGKEFEAGSAPASVAPLIDHAFKAGAKKTSAAISKSYLTLSSLDSGTAKPMVQFRILGHFDLAPGRSADGKESQFLLKDTSTNPEWEKRAYIEVDPFDARPIKPASDVKQNLYLAADLKDRTLVVGTDSLPGLTAARHQELKSRKRLRDGDTVQLVLTQTHLTVYRQSAASGEVLYQVQVSWIDLVRSRNENDEETSDVVRNSTDRIWSQREFVEILPDNVEMATTSLSLAQERANLGRKSDLEGCRAARDVGVEVLAKFLLSLDVQPDESICLVLRQTTLSVFRGSPSLANLLGTFGIDHVDVEFPAVEGREAPLASLQITRSNPDWQMRRHVILDGSNPQRTDNQVGPNAIAKELLAGEWIYTATVLESHSDNDALFPGLTLSSNNRLRFAIENANLSAYKLHEKLNTSGVATPMLRYAIDEFTVGRARNGFNDETNVIAELRDQPAEMLKHIRADFTRNQIPGYFNDLLGPERFFFRSWFVAGSTMVGNVTLEDGMISWTSEEVLQPDVSSGNTGAGETGLEPVAARVKHVFLRVDKRASGYAPKTIEPTDFSRFGFFLTELLSIDPDGSRTDEGITQFLNRFDVSNGKTIDFYLSKDYPTAFLDEAQATVAAWNRAFAKALGRSDVVRLLPNSGQSHGDPRVNMIVWVAGEQAGPLGYGPSIPDPVTGEIISAKSYIYEGAVKWSRRAAGLFFDEARGMTAADFERESRLRLAAQRNGGSAPVARELPGRGRSTDLFAGNLDLTPELRRIDAALPQTVREAKRKLAQSGELRRDSAAVLKSAQSSRVTSEMMKTQSAGLAMQTEVQDTFARFASVDEASAKALRLQGRHCAFAPEFSITSAGTMLASLPQDITREQFMDLVESASVLTTLMHEVGHNLGLRHNFAGSFDEANFHDQYFQLMSAAEGEAVAAGEFPGKYRTSTVMDYLDLFEGLAEDVGKYDVAALKFGYAGNLEVVRESDAGDILTTDVPVAEFRAAVAAARSENPELGLPALEQLAASEMGLRNYRFCTDGEVMSDITCRQFDRGVSITEIAENLVTAYEARYAIGAFRRGNRLFTGSSMGVISQTMLPLRQIYDEFLYRLINDQLVEENPFFVAPGSRRDFIGGLEIARDFFARTLATVEPGVYHLDEAKGEWVSGRGPTAESKVLSVPVGRDAKYLEATAIDIGADRRVVRRGIDLDKAAALMVMSMRGFPGQKYREASLTLNFFDLFRAETLEAFSEVIRREQSTARLAVRDTAGGTYRLVSADEAATLAEGSDVIEAAMRPSTNEFVQQMALIFAVSDFNNAGDRSFGDYVDIRQLGVDDGGIAGQSGVASFSTANGTTTWVVPGTRDGLSIAHAVASKAAEQAATRATLIEQLAAVNAVIAELRAPIVLDVAALFRIARGRDLPADTIAALTTDLDENLESLIGFVTANFGPEGEVVPDNDEADALKVAFFAKVAAYRAAGGGSTAEISSQIEDLERDLTRAEADLRQLKLFLSEFGSL